MLLLPVLTADIQAKTLSSVYSPTQFLYHTCQRLSKQTGSKTFSRSFKSRRHFVWSLLTATCLWITDKWKKQIAAAFLWISSDSFLSLPHMDVYLQATTVCSNSETRRVPTPPKSHMQNLFIVDHTSYLMNYIFTTQGSVMGIKTRGEMGWNR